LPEKKPNLNPLTEFKAQRKGPKSTAIEKKQQKGASAKQGETERTASTNSFNLRIGIIFTLLKANIETAQVNCPKSWC